MSKIYEVIRVIRKSPIFLTEHLDRMQRSAELLNLGLNTDRRLLIRKIAELIEKEPRNNYNIRIDYRYQEDEYDLQAITGRYISPKVEREGVRVTTFPYQRVSPNIKQENSDWREKMERQKAETNSFEILYVDQGNILEATKANIFFVKENHLVTPMDRDVLKGVTRDKVIEIAEGRGIAVKQQTIGLSHLKDYDAAFLTGTSINLLPIHQIDEIPMKLENPLQRSLLREYKLLMVSELHPLNEE